jgi:uncharacterized protein YjbI with pentapeptide repeats/DNA-binding Xre family transcriptional regulator
MTDPSQGKKKRKITYAASPQGIEKAEKALKRLGFESKINLAKSQLLSRSTVTKFFQCQPIQLDSLKRICEALTLDWKELVLMGEEEPSQRLEIHEPNKSETNEGVEQVQTLSCKVTVLDKHSQVTKAVIILEGDFNSINNNLSVSLQAVLREFSGDTIKITDIEEGSIRLIIEGSPEDIGQLISRFNSREFTEVSGFPIQDVQILSESSDEDESNELNDKWLLVQEIITQVVDGRNLRGADLSDTDLRGADLRGADLSDVDLSGADLSGANLIGAKLMCASLMCATLVGANLSEANLSGADLSSATLIHTNLIRANLRNATLIRATLIRTNLSDANLNDADLSGADLSGANLSDVDLSVANLIVANLSSANLSGANLMRANLSGANLSDATLVRATLMHADLMRARLRRVNLRDTDLSNADLRDTDLFGANLSVANLSDADLSDADLSDADLSDADLSDADLSGTNLRGANLNRAVVEKAQFAANLGLTEEMKLDLKRRGAIFEDFPSDRSGVLSGR